PMRCMVAQNDKDDRIRDKTACWKEHNEGRDEVLGWRNGRRDAMIRFERNDVLEGIQSMGGRL
uniref:hypothetical protein n=1 Tax=Bartonella tribocorum TaxID=85701 RepID=UPI001ABB236F